MKLGRPRQFDEAEALEAVTQVFWKKGYEATTKRDLMEATGIASQSLYNVFGDKRQIFEAALKHYRDTRMSIIQQMLETTSSPLENLRSVVRMFGDPPEEFRKGCFLCNAAMEFCQREDDPIATMISEKLHASRELFQGTFARAQELGEIAQHCDPAHLAAMLVSLANGIAVMYRSQASQEFMTGAMHEALRWLDSLGVPAR